MSIDLKDPSKQVEEIRLPTLLSVLQKRFGQEWFDLEDETISFEMGLAFTPLLVDKVNVLRILALSPELAYEDVVFFFHSADVFSNIVADFETFPIPNSLQIAWLVKELRNIVDGQFSDGVKTAVTKILIHEGFSAAPGPLLEVCFPELLVEGQEAEDRQAKADAVQQYLNYMESFR